MFGLKMIGLTRAIQICSHFITHLIPAQTIAIFVPESDIWIEKNRKFKLKKLREVVDGLTKK